MRAGAGRSAGRIGAGYFLVEGGSGRDLASRYVRHCHILEHENNDMVGTYEVLKQEVTGMARTLAWIPWQVPLGCSRGPGGRPARTA